MPVYEYRCAGCGHCFEKLVSASARDSSIRCPRCGHADAARLLSTFAAFSAGGGQTAALGGCCGGGSGGCACRG